MGYISGHWIANTWVPGRWSNSMIKDSPYPIDKHKGKNKGKGKKNNIGTGRAGKKPTDITKFNDLDSKAADKILNDELDEDIWANGYGGYHNHASSYGGYGNTGHAYRETLVKTKLKTPDKNVGSVVFW